MMDPQIIEDVLSASGVIDGTTDDLDGLINFVRGTD